MKSAASISSPPEEETPDAARVSGVDSTKALKFNRFLVPGKPPGNPDSGSLWHCAMRTDCALGTLRALGTNDGRAITPAGDAVASAALGHGVDRLQHSLNFAQRSWLQENCARPLRLSPACPQCAQGFPMRTQYASRNPKLNQP